MRYITATLPLAALTAAPAIAKHRIATTVIVADPRLDPRGSVDNESNGWWLDYQTDLSEARRELASDLRRANDAGDRRDAYAEYRREVADARNDYQKEMVERGYRSGTVTLEGDPG